VVTERLKLYHTFLLNGKLIVSAFVCGPCKTAVWAAPNSFTRMPMMISCTTHNNPAWQNHVYHRFELRHLLKTTAVTGSLCVVCHIRPEMHACLLATLISGRLIASPYPQESARLHWMKTKFFFVCWATAEVTNCPVHFWIEFVRRPPRFNKNAGKTPNNKEGRLPSSKKF